MVVSGSSTSGKRFVVGIIVAIAALAGIVLLVSHTLSNYGRASSEKEIALAAAGAVYSNNARALQRMWKCNVESPNFVYRSSQAMQKYGPVKEVVHYDQRHYAHPGMAKWTVVAERGSYTMWTHVDDAKLVGCGVNTAAGGCCTGSYIGR